MAQVPGTEGGRAEDNSRIAGGHAAPEDASGGERSSIRSRGKTTGANATPGGTKTEICSRHAPEARKGRDPSPPQAQWGGGTPGRVAAAETERPGPGKKKTGRKCSPAWSRGNATGARAPQEAQKPKSVLDLARAQGKIKSPRPPPPNGVKSQTPPVGTLSRKPHGQGPVAACKETSGQNRTATRSRSKAAGAIAPPGPGGG